MKQAAYTNRLADETSPYLLQHAHNPVDWYPWGEEALARARDEDKPILVSIGYSACHWCHVMERESFENPEIARIMNHHFVCIKVDREERPDLDKIYQLGHQMLTQRPGGWPLNMILMPEDHTPFFGGTYFPPGPRHGMPSFTDVLKRVAAYYRDHRQELEQNNQAVREAFARTVLPAPDPKLEIDAQIMDAAIDELRHQFDPRYGGFGQAPKFPHPTNLELCLYYRFAGGHPAERREQALQMLRTTLHAMASGGIYDQVGGGFCRYSVDAQWMIPHFEKMLYDNGSLQALYADAALATKEDRFGRVAIGIGDWVMREMQAPGGGYYSTLDADSQGEEGRFYVWATDQLRGLLNENEWAVVESRYGLEGTPNFEGKWNLHTRRAVDDIAKALDLSSKGVREQIDSAHAKLFAARAQRPRPGRDEKILTSWNGLMIKGMARAGRLLNRPDFVDSAARALDFVRHTLWQDGRLLVTTKDGKTHLNAYLDDHVFVIGGALELLQAHWRSNVLDFAIALTESLLDRFEDSQNGGFFFTSNDHEKLIHRHKPTSDEATPSGNGIAAQVLLRLGHLLGETRYLDAAERTIKGLYASLKQFPHAHGSLLLAVDQYLSPGETIVIRAPEKDLDNWLERTREAFSLKRFVVGIPEELTGLPGLLGERRGTGHGVAYVCAGRTCEAPIDTLDALGKRLVGKETFGIKKMGSESMFSR